MTERYKEIAKQKQAIQSAAIPQEWRLSKLPGATTVSVLDIPRTCGILNEKEIGITENYDATALASAIADRQLTSVEVTRAFCKRAAIAQQLTNCLTEIFFDQALKRAEFLDHHLSRHGKPVGPLHGVPVSVKDCFQIPGYDACIGYAAFCFKPCNDMSALVSLLVSAGAVLYCKTNIPQTMMALDSVNNVFGRVVNPINKQVTAGGSSGGEGALIGLKGSVLGVGTDIGGSIRIPAMCNNIYGIKPSANRVPSAGLVGGIGPGFSKLAVELSAGPMARTLRDCELFFKTVAASRPWLKDPTVIPGEWDSLDQATPSETPWITPLTIGIMARDGLVEPLPPIKKVLDEVADSLKKGGVRVIPIAAPAGFQHYASIANGLFGPDGSNTSMDILESFDEPPIPWLAPILKRGKWKTVPQMAGLQAQRLTAMRETVDVWTQPDGRGGRVELDAIVCPVAPFPVPPLDSWGSVSWTSSWVLLDYPAGTMPVRNFVEADMAEDIDESGPAHYWEKKNRALWSRKSIDRRVYLGTPLAIQVVAPRLQEKRLYRAMAGIDRILHPQAEGSDASSLGTGGPKL